MSDGLHRDPARTDQRDESARAAGVVATTPWQSGPDNRRRAQELAEWFRCPLVERGRRSVRRLLADEGADVAVVADHPPKLYHRAAPEVPLFFHPGLALQRIAQLYKGQPDRLVRAGRVRPGDRVVDGTLGLGADSLVLAAAVGPEGRVTAVESSWCIARLFEYASRTAPEMYPGLAGLFPRIDVVVGDHADVLAAMDADSVDVVVFDPMFRLPPRRPTAMDPVRPFANPSPLSDRAWAEAKRVVRRCVVLKERPGSGEFERFGLVPDKPKGHFAFGAWCKG